AVVSVDLARMRKISLLSGPIHRLFCDLWGTIPQIFRILPRLQRLLLQRSLAIRREMKSAIVKGVIVSIDFGTKLAQIGGASCRLRTIRDVMDQQAERPAGGAGLREGPFLLDR